VSRPERPAPPPLEGDDRLITGVITAGFAAALIVLLVVRDWLPFADRWWVWVAAFGTFMGLFGLAYVPYLKRSRERAAERRRHAREQRDARDQDS
jgi:membrane associated rhomboid family serine protease